MSTVASPPKGNAVSQRGSRKPALSWSAITSQIISELGPDRLLALLKEAGLQVDSVAGHVVRFNSLDGDDGTPSAWVNVETGQGGDDHGGGQGRFTIFDVFAKLRVTSYIDEKKRLADLIPIDYPGKVRHNTSSGASVADADCLVWISPKKDSGERLLIRKPSTDDASILQAYFDEHRPGINAEAAIEMGAVRVTWVKTGISKKNDKPYEIRIEAIATPVFGDVTAKRIASGSITPDQIISELPCGYIAWSIDPKKPFTDKNKQPLKVKNVGTCTGIVGLATVKRLADRAINPTTTPIVALIKAEGPSDAMAIHTSQSAEERDLYPVFTLPAGAKQSIPKRLLELFAKFNIYICHDADVPGQKGAAESGANLATVAGDVVNVVPPFEIADKHGKDFRDYFIGGGTFGEMLELFATGERIGEKLLPSSASIPSVYSPDDLSFEENRTEMALARMFAAAYSGKILYSRDQWLFWDGKRWKFDDEHRVEQYVKDFSSALWVRIKSLPVDDHLAKELAGMVKRLSTANGMRNMLTLARSEIGIPISPDELDANIWHFNVRNGTIDTQTGAILPHNPAHHITKCANVTYDPTADCPLWKKTIAATCNNSEGLVRHIQEVLGYFMTGSTREHLLFIAYGMGSNGKTTIIETASFMFGDYAMAAMPDLLLAKKEGHPTEIAMLQGRRMVSCTETDEGRRFAESRLKALTGGDPMTARFICGDPFQFTPSHKLIVSTNHKPELRGTDNGIRRRLNLIPFTVTFSGENRDRLLPEKLKAELPGILNWCLEGCLRWQREGLSKPDEVGKATQDYIDEQDVVGRFIKERCIVGDTKYEVLASALYFQFKQWLTSTGEREISMKVFGQSMAERGHEKQRKSEGYYYQRIETIPSSAAPLKSKDGKSAACGSDTDFDTSQFE